MEENITESIIAQESNTSDQNVTTEQARELVKYFETTHRRDLAYHLYSLHLLKQVLLRNNTNNASVEKFVHRRLPKSLSAWPRPETLIKPCTDEYYFSDNTTDKLPSPGVSMMNLELQALFERKVREKYSLRGSFASAETLKLPEHLRNSIYTKLNDLLGSLQLQRLSLKFSKSKIALDSDPDMNAARVNLKRNYKTRHRLISYEDILNKVQCTEESFDKLTKKSNHFFAHLNTHDKAFFKSKVFKISKPMKTDKQALKTKKLKTQMRKEYRKNLQKVKLDENEELVFKNDIYTLEDALMPF
ncbi:hypothetical protein ACO0QE_003822 [Hanseniaspora vineae]